MSNESFVPRAPVLDIARIIVEAATPMSISTGHADGVFDSALVRDANRLPAIPASSLTGVLRSLFQREHGRARADRLFGHQKTRALAATADGDSPAGSHLDAGAPSRIRVSWGCILDGKGQPAEGLLLGKAGRDRLKDPVFANLIGEIDMPRYRNRVRLGHRGAAADQGKFDRSVLLAGHRFALELRQWSEGGKDASTDWADLLAMLAHPGFRLGGGTRAGLGKIRLVRCDVGRFDLRDPAQRKAWLSLGRSVADRRGLQPRHPACSSEHWLEGRLSLSPLGSWRIGQGDSSLGNSREDKDPDLLPVSETCLEWDAAGHARPGKRLLLVPGAGVKGALAHRMAFHARRIAGEFAQADGDAALPAELPRPDALVELLGDIKSRTDSGSDAGRAGALLVDDAYVRTQDVNFGRQMHNAIDRFTGGVREHLLFEEENVYGGKLNIEIVLDTSRLGDHADVARAALRLAIADLCTGRLGLGSRSTTGNGFFSGSLQGRLSEWLGPVTHPAPRSAP